MITIENEVKDILLKGFEDYDLKSLSFFVSEHHRVKKHTSEISFIRLIAECFVNRERWNYDQNKASSILFVLHHTRKNYVNLVHTVADLVTEKSIITLCRELNFSFRGGIKMLSLLFSWKKSLMKTKLSNEQINTFIYVLIGAKRFDSFINKNCNLKVFKLIVVLYDAQTFGNLIVQKAKRKGIKTATLSHGVVLAERDDQLIDYCGIELRGSISDYFLAWNNFSKNEAILQGLNPQKIKILGVPYFINNTTQFRSDLSTDHFGLILDNQSGDLYNKQLIKIANLFAEENNLKYTIRYHPSFDGNEYDDLIDWKYYIGKNEDTTIILYSQKVKFSLLANSTVFIELTYLNHKIYRYGDQSIHDKFRESKIETFTTLEGLSKLYLEKRNSINIPFENLCTIANVKKSYKAFFSQFS